MRIGQNIAVVVPAFNEAKLLVKTLRGLPDWIDTVVVIDDGSTDKTAAEAQSWGAGDSRLVLIRHPRQLGVGAAIRSGYLWCREHSIDAAVVMAGDGQMNPDDLPAMLDPILQGEADYTKGNRFTHPDCQNRMPAARYRGTWVLSWFTRALTGYWHIFDSQSGFTVVNHRGLHTLPLEGIYSGYGVPNDLLVTMSLYGMRVMDVPIEPIYGIGERSKMKLPLVTLSLSVLLVRLSFRRLAHLLRRATSRGHSENQVGSGPTLQDSSPS